MNLRDLILGVAGEDDVSLIFAEARHHEELTLPSAEEVGLVHAPFPSPLEEAVCRDQASPFPKCISEECSLGRGLRAGIDREAAGRPLEPPLGIGENRPLRPGPDDRIPLPRRDVVSRPELDPGLAEGVEWQGPEQ